MPLRTRARALAHNHAMEQANELEQRIAELEIKAAFSDDLLDVLNRQVARQQDQIEMLAREMLLLRRQVAAAGSGEGAPASLRDEIPPHY
jgi:SlyX protein